ncbi:MAG: hypothetical protein FH753_15000 [Firmicutes bacterium]|nr:hypothetical protein [Bacillota bacterium]
MKKFKSDLNKKLKLMTFLVFLVAVIVFLIGFLSYKTVGTKSDVNDFILGVQTGTFIGLELVIIFKIRKYKNALKDSNMLQKLYIEKNDERNKLILLNTHSTGLYVIMIVLSVATIISGFLNATVFFTLASVFMFIGLTVGFLGYYYSKKY